MRRSTRIIGTCLLLACCLVPARLLPAAHVDYFLKLDGVDGESTDISAAAYDEALGLLTIARGLNKSDPEWKYVSVRRYASHFDGRFLTAADLNNDQKAEIIIPAYAANKLLIIWGDTLDQAEIVPEIFDVGPGPMAAAVGELTGADPRELLIATTGAQQVGVRGWDFVTKEPVTGTTAYSSGFAQEGLLGFATSGASASASNPALAFLRLDAGSNGRPTIQVFAQNPTPIYGPLNSIRNATLNQPFTTLVAGHPLGGSQPGWLLAWAPGLTSVAMIPSTGGAVESYDLGAPITRAQLQHGTHSSGAHFLFGDGSVRFYDFNPGQGFALRQQLDPPPGDSFAAVAGSGDSVVLLSRDGPYSSFKFLVAIDSGAGLEPVNEGEWPEPPALGGQTTVALYTSDPFGASPLLVESFAAGDWASGAQLNGNLVDAVVESFGGPTAGLGNPAAQSLQPGVVPGVGAGVLGNQWERSSSLFYAGSPLANGLAPVGIQPSAGNYPKSIAVSFQPGTDVSVHYRVNLGPWQTGVGPVWLSQSATIEYFGEHAGGSLSPIQSAVFEIDQPPDADGDGDGVPDAIEALAGTDPTKADSDGDGDSDLQELLAGSDPHDPASRAGPHVKVFDGKDASFVWDDPASGVVPADDQDLFFSDPASPGQAATKGAKIPGLHKVSDVTLKRGVISQQAWFPASYAVEGGGLVGPAMTALVGVVFPPVPDIPIDLSAADPVAVWLAATQQAVDEFHAEPLEFTVGPASALGAVIIEYWYGTRLLDLGRISSLADRPRLADSPNSPQAGHLTEADVMAVQQPATFEQEGHELAHVMQQLNTTLQQDEAFAPLRAAAEAAFAQAVQANQKGTPLDPPVHALRSLISGDPLPAGFVFPIVQAAAMQLRDQLLAMVNPRLQFVRTGKYTLWDYNFESSSPADGLLLLAGVDRYRLLGASGNRWHPPGGAIIPPDSIVAVRAFALERTPPIGITADLEVIELTVLEVPEAGYADLDGNGLPDLWEQVFLGGGGSPLGGDTDGDGFLDPEELGAGTDPTDPLSMPAGPPATPREMRIEFTPGVGPSLVWDGSTTVDYEVWVTTGFFAGAGWNPLPTTVQSSGPERRVAPIDDTQPQSFYRVRLKFPWLNEP